jgi:hypothetical protein
LNVITIADANFIEEDINQTSRFQPACRRQTQTHFSHVIELFYVVGLAQLHRHAERVYQFYSLERRLVQCVSPGPDLSILTE